MADWRLRCVPEDDGGLGTPFLPHRLFNVKWFLMEPSFLGQRPGRRRLREWAPNLLVGGGGDGCGLTERGYKKKPIYGDTVKSSLIQDS